MSIVNNTGKGQKFDAGKIRPSLLPIESLEAVCEVLEFGAQKYAANGWQTVPNGQQRYLDALYRHLFAYTKGEKQDPETGLSHLAHMGCNILFLLWLEAENAHTKEAA